MYSIQTNDSLSTDEVFQFLEALRLDGCTNMLGATPYLVKEFGLDRKEATKWLVRWIQERDDA